MDEIIKFLENDVQELLDSHDFLGTSSDGAWADKQEREWQAKLAKMIEFAKTYSLGIGKPTPL